MADSSSRSTSAKRAGTPSTPPRRRAVKRSYTSPAVDGGLSQRINRFTAATEFDDLPADVVERGKRSLLDTLGCAIFGRDAAAPGLILDWTRRTQVGDEATIVCDGGRSTAFGAALANGAFVHSTELAETFTRAFMHPSSCVIPAAFAVAERQRKRGADLLTAIAVGYELLIRFGLAVSPEFALEQGMHPPATLAVFGATAAAASLLGLGEDQAASALGIAAGNAPTAIKAATDQQATVKDLYQAYAGALATMCADLAALGLTGPAAWLEPWVAAIVRTLKPQAFAGLGDEWQISSGGLKFKLVPIMGMGQPVLAAVKDIHEQGPLTVGAIESIVVESSDRIFLSDVGYPRNAAAMRASIPFLVAAALVRRDEFLADHRHLVRFLRDDLLADAAIEALAARVELRADPAITATMESGPRRTLDARVTLRFHDGSTRAAYHDIWPEVANLTYDDVAAKFRAVTAGRLPEARAEAVIARVAEVDLIDDVSELARLLA
jgi:2-methylcitrate dehydratase PrpD